MSQVKISGNASGTGTLTVAAPNTNSDYTMTLPAETGTVLTSASNIPTANLTGAITVDGSSNVGINTTSPGAKLEIKASGASGVNLKLTQYNSTDGWTLIADDNGGPLRFVRVGASLNGEAMRIDNSGKLLVGTTSGIANGILAVKNAGAEACSFQGGSNGYIVTFHNTSGTLIGSITGSTGSTTSYNTSSDYRLKENIAPMVGALAKVAALKPVTYTWKVDGSDGQGFIAHELQAVVPDCVTGEKDAEREVDVFDEDGNKTGTKMEPVYQGVDTSFLVATLTAAIQELKAELDAAKERIAALEAGNVPT